MKRNITKFNYSPYSIRKMIKSDDFWRFKIDKNKVQEITTTISQDFIESEGDVKEFNTTNIYNKTVFTLPELYDKLSIRNTNDIIKTTFDIAQFTRDLEVSQLIEVLKGECTNSKAFILKADIKSFFESIRFDETISELYKKSYILKITFSHLYNISELCKQNGIFGLPRGLSISSSMSEYFMKEFDYNIRKLPNCIYYSRYVDDFIVIFSDEISDVISTVSNLLPDNLELNNKKTQCVKIGESKSIDFLGYKIPLNSLDNVSIADKKINKTKTRLIKAICHFTFKDNNYQNLISRLNFLTSNSSIKVAGRKKKVFLGFKFQYSKCSRSQIIEQLEALDKFYRNVLESKHYNLSIKLRSRLNSEQINKLRKISFVSGYNSNIVKYITRSKASLIKEAWKYA